MRFHKMHGCGNDFILVDARQTPELPWPDLARRWCRRHFGVGADGLILLLDSASADWRMRIFNADGTEPEMCGNGIRCFARFVRESGAETRDAFTVETLAGPIVPEIVATAGSVWQVAVDMGSPRLRPEEIPILGVAKDRVVEELLVIDDDPFSVTCVSMGNPHCVVFVEDLDKIAVEWFGPAIERHERFPARTNVEFVQVQSPTDLQMRVWERGAGRTLACGTGACATLVAAHLNGLAERRATVHLEGGDLLIDWRADDRVLMTGPAETVCRGELDL